MLKLLFVLWMTLSSVPFHSDDLDLAAVEGVITDPLAHRIADATILITSLATLKARSLSSNQQGYFRIDGLQPGSYEILVTSPGFAPVNAKLRLSAGAFRILNFKLEPDKLRVAVTVVADPILPEISRTAIGQSLDDGLIETLPIPTRNPYDLAALIAGASLRAYDDQDLSPGDAKDHFLATPEESGTLSLSGSPAFSNNITIEGLDNNDDRAARERFVPLIDSVEQLQVISSQFSAEYGRASGGRINIRLRSGTNQLHGSAFYGFSDESLNANSWGRNADPARGFRLPFQQNTPGGTLGGPIWRNKLFFYSGVEFDRVYDQADVEALVPVQASPLFPLPSPTGANLGSQMVDGKGRVVVINGGAAVGLFDERLATPRSVIKMNSRLDLKGLSRHDIFAIVTVAREKDQRAFPGGERLPETLRTAGRNSQSASISDTFALNSKFLLQSRIQYSQLDPQDSPEHASPVVLITVTDPRDGSGSLFSRTGTLIAGSSNSSATLRRERRWQLQEVISSSFKSHAPRLGFDLQKINSSYKDLTDTTGTYRFDNPADFLAGNYSRFSQRFNTGSRLGNRYTGAFILDEWRPAAGLLVLAGLRWDYETLVGGGRNFGPRAALAWTPRTSGRLVIRAGFGIFYNRALLRTLDDFSLGSRAITIDTAISPALASQVRFPGPLLPTDPLVTAYGVRDSQFLRRVESRLHLPSSYQGALGIGIRLGSRSALEINTVTNFGRHLWRESNINAARLPAGFPDFTSFLLSQNFDNRIDPATGLRPISATGSADVVRFDLGTASSTVTKNGTGNIVTFGLNNQSTSNATAVLRAALGAVRNLRPNPSLTQVEEIQSRGNSLYNGLQFSLRNFQAGALQFSLSYTLSRTIDDGTVNTSSPLIPGDFRQDRALSLLDARHRLVSHIAYLLPRYLGHLTIATLFTSTSGRPFNLGIGGNDRNLDDVNTDRPDYSGNASEITWNRPGNTLNPTFISQFSLPTIGRSGNLPRNAGHGPAQWTLNTRLSRVFHVTESSQLTPVVEIFNPLNSAVFSFGAEYVDFTPANTDTFLTPTRTLKPRNIRLSLKYTF